jgi:hypothetical protein
LNNLHAAPIAAKFFGNDHWERGANALAHLGFSAPDFYAAVGVEEKKKGRSRLAPVAAEVFRKARRVTFEDKSTSPKESDACVSKA